MNEVPEDRCGYTTPDSTLPQGSGGLCCWLPTWDSQNRCIWHAEDTEKGDELLKACSDRPKYLYGAVLREVDADGINLSNCELLQADFSKGSFSRGNFSNSDITYGDFSGANLHRANFSNTRFLVTNFSNACLQFANLQNSYGGYTDFSKSNIWHGDFSGSILGDSDFSASILFDTDFSDCELSQSDFTDSVLQGAKMSESDLSDTRFYNSKLQGIDLSQSNLRKANLRKVNLEKADIIGADLQGVDCTESDLSKVDLTNANLSESDLSEGNLTGTCLNDATLSRVNLDQTEMVESDLSQATARSASFNGANLEDATFVRTELRDANLRNTRLYQTLFSDTRINSNTDFGEKSTYENPDTDLGEQYENTSRWEAASWVYRRLRDLHEENAMSEKAREYHVRKEEAQRQDYRAEGQFFQWFVHTLNLALTRHGESLKRIVAWSVGTILLSAFFYPFFGGFRDASNTVHSVWSIPSGSFWELIPLFARSLYFSTVTFTTLGYGDYQPVGPFSKALAGAESLAGALLVALFVFVLGRRVAR